MEDSSKMEETDARVARFGPFRYEFAAGRLVRDNEELPLPPRGHAVSDHVPASIGSHSCSGGTARSRIHLPYGVSR